VLDEAHEYGNYDSAQAQAAERLVATHLPVVFATGTACNGYMSSMHAFFRALSPDYARDFARDDRPAAVARFGYQRRQVDLTGKAPKSTGDDGLELGAVSDRVVKGGVKVTGQAPGILPEALLRYLAPATAQVHLDDLGVDARTDSRVLGLAVEHRGIEMTLSYDLGDKPWRAHCYVEQPLETEQKLIEAAGRSPDEALDECADAVEEEESDG